MLLGGFVLALGLAGCSPSDDSDDKSKDSPDAPAEVAYDMPDNFTLDPDLDEPAHALAEKFSVETYTMDGATAFDRIAIVSYVLPKDAKTETSDEKQALTEEYNKALESDSEVDGIPNVALINGEEGVLRRAVFEDGEGNARNQDNYFLFDGPYAVQVSCEWEAGSDEAMSAMYQACQTVLQNLEIKQPES